MHDFFKPLRKPLNSAKLEEKQAYPIDKQAYPEDDQCVDNYVSDAHRDRLRTDPSERIRHICNNDGMTVYQINTKCHRTKERNYLFGGFSLKFEF